MKATPRTVATFSNVMLRVTKALVVWRTHVAA